MNNHEFGPRAGSAKVRPDVGKSYYGQTFCDRVIASDVGYFSIIALLVTCLCFAVKAFNEGGI
jgi:hypothetical protein